MAVDWRTLVGAKTAAEVVTTFLDRLAQLGSQITNFNVGGEYRTFVELVGQASEDLYDLVVEVIPKGFLPWSEDAWLDAKAEELNLTKFPASKTRGQEKFYRAGNQGNVVIAAGVVVATKVSAQGEVLKFVVTVETVLPDGQTSVLAPIEAEIAGARYNVAPGLITEMVTHVEGIDGVVNEADWITEEGRDEEEDEDLRERCRLRWYELSRGATKHAYIAWAREVPGVVDVAVDDQFPRGEGTVDVIITGEAGQPSPQLIQHVQDYLDARRPICTDLLVKGPAEVPVHVRVSAYLPLDSGDETATETAILDLYSSLFITGAVEGVPRLGIGQNLYRARLAALGMGVQDVFNLVVESPAADVDTDPDELVTLEDAMEIIVERGEP